MTLTGDIFSITESLLHLQNHSKQGIYHMSLSFEAAEQNTIIVEKGTLKPVEELNTESDCFIIQKAIYDQFMNVIKSDGTNSSLIKKTEPISPKTYITFPKTEENNTNSISTEIGTHQFENEQPISRLSSSKPNLKNQNRYSDSDLYIIEEHEFDCMSNNRPTVFAIKFLGENYYTLYYRKSVYDAGNDTAFRKFLSLQPGKLVAYRYCNSVNSIREEFHRLGLSLRHNGKNELSKPQADELLHTFHTLRFL